MLRQRGRLLKHQEQRANDDIPRCRPCHLYAAGFNFCDNSVIEKVPYDPHSLHNLFFGEELSMSVRLFTHGYSLLSPPESVVYHLWSRSHRPTQHHQQQQGEDDHNKRKKQAQRETSLRIVRDQLTGKLEAIDTRYGLGTVRTVEEYWETLKVDYANQLLLTGSENGGLLDEDFWDNDSVGSMELYPTDSIETKIVGLDFKSKGLIAFFLGNMEDSGTN